MAVKQQTIAVATRLRQFVVRLEQPGLYDRLLRASNIRSEEEGRKVAMTEIAREAIEEKLDRDGV